VSKKRRGHHRGPAGTVPGAPARSGPAATGPAGPSSAPFTTRAAATVGAWSPTVARLLLGAVLAWFGYHELVAPGLWTGYVPALSPTSRLAEIGVLAHGFVLLLLAAALLAGIAPRLAAGIAALLLLEIVCSLWATGGLSDLVLRDVGVLGLSIALLGRHADQRLVLRG
jgi:uncharacterized membrane protein YphA (DoxX/SURF4 family)